MKKGFTPSPFLKSCISKCSDAGYVSRLDDKGLTLRKVRGFTLLELLIVIGILAILATITILVLNPAELLRRARDTQRLADLTSLRNGIGLYVLSVQTSADMNNSAHTASAGSRCTDDGVSTTTTFVSSASAPSITGWTAMTGTGSGSAQRAVDGSGWVPVKFSDIGGGSPLARLPIDPVNDATSLFYTYTCNQTNLVFELSADMESLLFASTGTSDKESTDGGTRTDKYEVGTDPDLNIGPY